MAKKKCLDPSKNGKRKAGVLNKGLRQKGLVDMPFYVNKTQSRDIRS